MFCVFSVEMATFMTLFGYNGCLSQYCGCWWPGALAPGHPQPQYWPTPYIHPWVSRCLRVKWSMECWVQIRWENLACHCDIYFCYENDLWLFKVTCNSAISWMKLKYMMYALCKSVLKNFRYDLGIIMEINMYWNSCLLVLKLQPLKVKYYKIHPWLDISCKSVHFRHIYIYENHSRGLTLTFFNSSVIMNK